MLRLVHRIKPVIRPLSVTGRNKIDGAKVHWEKARRGRKQRGFEFSKRFRISTMGGHFRDDPAVITGTKCQLPYNPTWQSGVF